MDYTPPMNDTLNDLHQDGKELLPRRYTTVKAIKREIIRELRMVECMDNLGYGMSTPLYRRLKF